MEKIHIVLSDEGTRLTAFKTEKLAELFMSSLMPGSYIYIITGLAKTELDVKKHLGVVPENAPENYK